MSELSNTPAVATNEDLFFNLPSLKGTNVTVAPIDLMENYWTPEKEGEFRDMYFVNLKPRMALNQESGEITESLAVYFAEEDDESGEWISVCNSSTHLVARFEKADIPKNTPVRVTYRGKQKNKTNAKFSDKWRVSPLLIS